MLPVGLALAGVMISRLFQWLIPIGYGQIFHWQQRDDFNVLPTGSAQLRSGEAEA